MGAACAARGGGAVSWGPRACGPAWVPYVLMATESATEGVPEKCCKGGQQHTRAVQRLRVASWMAFSQDLLQGLRSLGFSAEVPESACRGRTLAGCVAEFASFSHPDDARLDHPLRFWVVDSVIIASRGLRHREAADPRVEPALLRL